METHIISSTTGLREGWSTPRPGHFAPGKEKQHLLQKRPVWTGEKNLVPTGFETQTVQINLN
jgi:hypothetical protein